MSMKWKHAIVADMGRHGQPPVALAEATHEQLVEVMDGMGQQGWQFSGTLNGVLVFCAPVDSPTSAQDRPGYQGQLDPEQREKVLWVWKHQQPAVTFENGRPVPTFSDCSHLFDAVVLEEHAAAVKIVATTGSEHGGATPGQAFWAKRRDLRFIARGEAVPELDGDPENAALRRMVDGG